MDHQGRNQPKKTPGIGRLECQANTATLRRGEHDSFQCINAPLRFVQGAWMAEPRCSSWRRRSDEMPAAGAQHFEVKQQMPAALRIARLDIK